MKSLRKEPSPALHATRKRFPTLRPRDGKEIMNYYVTGGAREQILGRASGALSPVSAPGSDNGVFSVWIYTFGKDKGIVENFKRKASNRKRT